MKHYSYCAAFVAALLLSACNATQPPAPAAPPPPEKSVWFVQPADGATVTSPFKVVFGVKGMSVDPAGEIKPNSGHHHLLINLGPVDAGVAIPADATHLHYGKAQTEADITLPPGDYKLTMQFANGAHQSYGPAMAATINVKVK